MTRENDKYRLVNGKVYRLARSFTTPRDAVEFAKKMQKEYYVFLTKGEQGLWSVYWRPRENEIECSIDVL